MVPEDARARILLAINHAYFAKEREAIKELEKAIELRPSDSGTLYNAACTYAILQRKEKAFATLSKAVEAGWENPNWAEKDPDLASVHKDPEFMQIMEEVRRKSSPGS